MAMDAPAKEVGPWATGDDTAGDGPSVLDMFELLYAEEHVPKLVGGLVAIFGIFPEILGTIIPIDFHIFQSGSNHQPDHRFWAYFTIGMALGITSRCWT